MHLQSSSFTCMHCAHSSLWTMHLTSEPPQTTHTSSLNSTRFSAVQLLNLDVFLYKCIPNVSRKIGRKNIRAYLSWTGFDYESKTVYKLLGRTPYFLSSANLYWASISYHTTIRSTMRDMLGKKWLWPSLLTKTNPSKLYPLVTSSSFSWSPQERASENDWGPKGSLTLMWPILSLDNVFLHVLCTHPLSE